MAAKCSRCGKPAFIFLPFFNQWFCRFCAEMLDS